jgi:tetratricopeptide (TPR) repeat protein
LFTENSETREHIKSAISNVCGYYETSKDWEKFQYFLDTLYKEKKYLFVWAPFVESCLSDKTNRWAKQYYTYTNSEPEFKLGIDCAIADTYMADEKYDDAAELYRDIIKRCGLGDDKEAYEFELCKCLFYGGKYSESIAMLDGFISNNKELHRKLVKEAMIVKGRAHIQLAEIDKAIYVFSAMMIEYPETKQTPEPNFFIGYCFMLQGEFEKATKSFDLVAKNYPESSYKNKARLCLSRIKNMTN